MLFQPPSAWGLRRHVRLRRRWTFIIYKLINGQPGRHLWSTLASVKKQTPLDLHWVVFTDNARTKQCVWSGTQEILISRVLHLFHSRFLNMPIILEMSERLLFIKMHTIVQDVNLLKMKILKYVFFNQMSILNSHTESTGINYDRCLMFLHD